MTATVIAPESFREPYLGRAVWQGVPRFWSMSNLADADTRPARGGCFRRWFYRRVMMLPAEESESKILAKREGEALLPHVRWVENAYQAAQGADVVVILTEWNEFRALDLAKLARKMATPRLADLRNIYNREDALAAGFETYEGVGR